MSEPMRELLIELADELSLYGYGLQEHARCPIIQELCERARLAAGAPPRSILYVHPYAGHGMHCNICLRSSRDQIHTRPKGTD